MLWATTYFWLGYALGAGYERLAGGPVLARVAPWGAALAAVGVGGALVWRFATQAKRSRAP
jgi:membrane protein DedA with SNARE-associated domain